MASSTRFGQVRPPVVEPGYRLNGRLNTLFMHVGSYSACVPQARTRNTAYGVWYGTRWIGWCELHDTEMGDEGDEE